jgi:hypothetical protein
MDYPLVAHDQTLTSLDRDRLTGSRPMSSPNVIRTRGATLRERSDLPTVYGCVTFAQARSAAISTGSTPTSNVG